MSLKTIQDILPLVKTPSRYLGSEINTIRKEKDTVKLRMCLAFPELYDIGTSHFGLQILYHILNKHKDISAERVFTPGIDMEAFLKSSHIDLFSLETQKPLNEFDIIGFSLLYELNFTNILTILDLANIPFFSSQRKKEFPLIIAGGPCTCNPEPVADFFDAIVIGDGEEVVIEISETIIRWKQREGGERQGLLKDLSEIKGVYIPSFYEPRYDKNGFQTLIPAHTKKNTIERVIVPEIRTDDFPDKPILPYGRPIHDRLRLEVARGCTRGCRFCQAGMIYRPVRERSEKDLLYLTQKGINFTGYEDISLLSLSTGDYSCVSSLMEQLMDRYKSERIAVSLPSIRAGTLTQNLMKHIKGVRKTGFTIAPEAGSQRLRDIINKNINREEIFETINNAFDMGWNLIKLYFMIGLPTETQGDLKEMVDLVRGVRKLKSFKGRKKQINVSVTTFIPKPHTPFQWAPQVSLEESKAKIDYIRKNLQGRGVNVKWQNPEASLLEGVFARGDRRLSAAIVKAHRKGCRFDGWTDSFNFSLWKDAFHETGVGVDFYSTRKRGEEELFPWDHIDIKVTKAYLKKEWRLGLKEERTKDCRRNECNECGVCDFKRIEPKLSKKSIPIEKTKAENEKPVCVYKKVKINYIKVGQAKYFGHLELMNIFMRAIKRASIPVKFSEGFHPKPKISFGDALPLGIESLNETINLTVSTNINAEKIVQGLNKELPEGLTVFKGCSTCLLADRDEAVNYTVTLTDEGFDKEPLSRFNKCSKFIISRERKKKAVADIDLKEMVSNIDLISGKKIELVIKTIKGKKIRPVEVIKNIFNIPEEILQRASILKTVK